MAILPTHVRRGPSNTLLSALRLLGFSLVLCLLRPCAASGQTYINVFLDISAGDDGTLYATGITDAGGMQEHSANIWTGINSPKGRTASAGNSVTSGGYARADTLLAFDETDTGNYTIWADGNGYCPVYGSLGSVVTQLIATLTPSKAFTYMCDTDSSGNCNTVLNFTNYTRCNPGYLCRSGYAFKLSGGSPPRYVVFFLSIFDLPPPFPPVCVIIRYVRADSCVPDPIP